MSHWTRRMSSTPAASQKSAIAPSANGISLAHRAAGVEDDVEHPGIALASGQHDVASDRRRGARRARTCVLPAPRLRARPAAPAATACDRTRAARGPSAASRPASVPRPRSAAMALASARPCGGKVADRTGARAWSSLSFGKQLAFARRVEHVAARCPEAASPGRRAEDLAPASRPRPPRLRVRDGCSHAVARRISKTICSADFSRAPGMSRPPAGIVATPSACRSMSLMM